MGSPAALVAQQGLSPMGIAATVTRAPADADDTLDLQWLSPRDGVDGEEAVGESGLRWVSTSRLPADDDDALLLVDSQGDPWAFVWATGAVMGDVSSSLTALDARLDALEVVANARVFNTANISVAHNTTTALTFNSERYDTGGLHSTISNTSRLTAPSDGLYEIGGNVRFAASTAGQRIVQISLTPLIGGGPLVIARFDPGANGFNAAVPPTFPIHTEYELLAGDYVELVVFQTSGGALNVEAVGNFSPEFWMRRVSA